jgi:small subunit ribosomal protein S16
MVVIRLSRGGSNKRPFYKVVAADSRAARDGKYLEQLGYFNPIASGADKRLELNQERMNYWLGQGAQPSERVQGLLQEFANPELVDKRKAKKAKRVAAKKEKAKLEAKAKADAEATEVKVETEAEEETTEEPAKEEAK